MQTTRFALSKGPAVSGFQVRIDDLSSAATRALLRDHLDGMHANSPPGHSFALDLEGLRAPDMTVWSVWDRDAIAGVAGLKQHTDGSGELKSMRTATPYLRRGVAALLLDHIVIDAKARGLSRLSLETGRGPAFEAALALYRKAGFIAGEAFADYVRSDFNQFYHLELC